MTAEWNAELCLDSERKRHEGHFGDNYRDASVDCVLSNSIASLIHFYGCDQDIIVTVGQCLCSQEIHPEVFRVKCMQGALNAAKEKYMHTHI